MKKNIGIIGAGQLGSRHLQSLADLDGDFFDIYVFDTSADSIKIAEERYQQCIKINSPEVGYFNDFSLLPKTFQTVIVATSSLVRRKVVENLMLQSEVEFLVLEKFLFPKIEDYSAVESLLKEKKVKCYVNTPRRTFDFYQYIKPTLTAPFHMEVTGANWGLGCNTIHYLDLFAYYSNNTEIEVINNLDNEIQVSKRAGYIEFTGSLIIKDVENNTITISSFKDGNRPNVLSISDQNQKITIHESGLSKMLTFFSTEQGYQYKETPIQLKFQSQLSAQFIQDLYVTGKCELTPYNESFRLHVLLLEVFLTHYNKITQQNSDLCPIT